MKYGGSLCVKANRKKIGKFFGAERAKGYYEAPEETLCMFSFLFVYPQQYVAIRFIQALRQVFQNTPNVRGKTAAQPFNLANNPLKPTAIERISIDC